MVTIREAVVLWGALLTPPPPHKRCVSPESSLWTGSMDNWTCIMGVGMQHAILAWLWTCSMSMGMNMQHDGHAACTWTCSMDMGMDMSMQHGHGHAGHWWWSSWPSPPPLSQAISDNCCFDCEDYAKRKAVWNFQTPTIFGGIKPFFQKG
jgi:hypothetical protein